MVSNGFFSQGFAFEPFLLLIFLGPNLASNSAFAFFHSSSRSFGTETEIVWRNCQGYCECKGGAKRHAVSCKVGSHSSFTCAAVCAAPDDGDDDEEASAPGSAALVGVAAGASWKSSALITPNNRNFPAVSPKPQMRIRLG